MASMRAHVHRVAADSLDDVSDVETLLEAGLAPKNLVAIIVEKES